MYLYEKEDNRMIKKIVASAWHPGSANAIAPVLKKLLQDKRIESAVIGHGFSENVFDRNGIGYKKLIDYGLSLERADELIDIEKPDLVLTGTSTPDTAIEKKLIMASMKNNIPSLAVLDFWGIYWQRFSDVNKCIKFCYLPTRIAIMDNIARMDMIDEGFPKDILIITGNPFFDSLVDFKESFSEIDRLKVRKCLGLDADKFVIMYVSQPLEDSFNHSFGYTEKTVFIDLLDALKKISGRERRQILVKIHPREDMSDLIEIAQKYNEDIIFDKEYDTRNAVMSSDLIVGVYSSVLVEALCMDKYVISLQPGLKKEDLLITNKVGATISVYRKAEIETNMMQAIFNNEFKENMRIMARRFVVNENATENVLNLIYNMLDILD